MPQSIFTKKEERFLKLLNEAGVDYIIVGLSAAALQGAPVVTQDIDLWFKDLANPKIATIARKVGATYIPSFGLNPPMFAGADLELFDIVPTLSGLQDYETEAKQAMTIELGEIEIKVLHLSQIIKSKKAANRDKDKIVLPVLQDSLLAIEKKRRIKLQQDQSLYEKVRLVDLNLPTRHCEQKQTYQQASGLSYESKPNSLELPTQILGP